MRLHRLKENILEAKLNLFRTQADKSIAVKEQHYEKAAHLRVQEKHIREHIENLKNNVLKTIHISKGEQGSISDYLLCNELLLEFHPIEFQHDCSNIQSIEAIDNYMNCYWRIREQIQDDLMKFLCDEYQNIRIQLREFNSESDHIKAKWALSRLVSISDIIQRHSH
jgi:hypothetical protein